MSKVDKKQFFTFMNVDEQRKNWFDLSHTNSGSANMGYLIPVLCEPTLPDDYFKVRLSYLLRLAQMVAPPMTRLKTSFFAFDCPNRILMDSKEWDKFLADVDGNSGIGLPSLSFSPIFKVLKDDLSSLLKSINANELQFLFENTELYDYLANNNLISGPDFGVVRFEDGLLFEISSDPNVVTEYNGKSQSVAQHIVDWLSSIHTSYPFVSTLLDYFGFPVNSPLFSSWSSVGISIDENLGNFYVSAVDTLSPTRSFQVLPMLAYLYIWNEYFRQEFIQEEIPDELLSNFESFKNMLGSDISIMWTLKRRDWEHDYFTSCLPAPQLGESSSIEIGDDGKFTIPELREANVIQKIREKLLHGGSRIFEILRNFFGSDVSDARLQISQFIAGNSSWLKISDIYQTAPGASDAFPTLDAEALVGMPKGASVNVKDNGLVFEHKAKEHGYLIVLMNIQPESVYCQGLPRHFLSMDTLDYGWPDFANITEQPVYNYEVYATPENSRPDVSGDYPIFGWQSQYSWYKFHNSELHGELRDDLDFFHFARVFDSEPALNDEFLTCNPSDRPFPITYEYDKITYHIAFDIAVERRLPYYGIPSLR